MARGCTLPVRRQSSTNAAVRMCMHCPCSNMPTASRKCAGGVADHITLGVEILNIFVSTTTIGPPTFFSKKRPPLVSDRQ